LKWGRGHVIQMPASRFGTATANRIETGSLISRTETTPVKTDGSRIPTFVKVPFILLLMLAGYLIELVIELPFRVIMTSRHRPPPRKISGDLSARR
jgi:hypothetical protein